MASPASAPPSRQAALHPQTCACLNHTAHPIPNLSTLIPLAPQGPKQRKQVDRRASKGRKLRYHVHEKLANFMAPQELEAPQFAAQLFTNLFGGGARK